MTPSLTSFYFNDLTKVTLLKLSSSMLLGSIAPFKNNNVELPVVLFCISCPYIEYMIIFRMCH